MKMTVVITTLRDVNPRLQESFVKLNAPLTKAVSLVKDAASCQSDEARKALVSAALLEVLAARVAYDDCVKLLGELDVAEKSYTRKFESGPRGPKDDPNQPGLPGMEASAESAPNETSPKGGDFVPQEA